LNVAVILICFGFLGWNLQGAGSAARNTARFASLFFVAGFAGQRLKTMWPLLPESAILIQAFCAAQMVHFASVALLHLRFAEQPLQPRFPQVAVVLVGFSLVAIAGLTATPKPAWRSYRVAQLLSIHIIFLIYFLDYLKHPVKPLRILAILFVIALALRYFPIPARHGRNRSASAST
jgi:hypothetical protein